MKKRNVIIVVLCALIISLVLGVLALLPSRPGVTKANFDRIEIGMTEAEVAQLLGPKTEQAFDAERILTRLSRSMKENERHFVWTDVDGTAMIRIDQDERVESKVWHKRDESLFERLRSLLPF